MKKLILSVFTMMCMFGFHQSHAQVDLTINPVGLLFGDLSIGADFILKDNFSLEGAVGFGKNTISDIKGTNIGVNAVGKYYFNPKHSGDRFYVDVFARFINRNWNYENNSSYADATSTRFGLGFGLGYKVVSAKGFVFDIGFGVGRALVTNFRYEDSTGIKNKIPWTPVIAQGKFGIGYRFGGSKK